MPTITRIYAQKRAGRYNVDIDGVYAFPIAEETLIKHMLVKGTELTAEELLALQTEDEGARAFSKALSYLASTPRTEHQVRTQLQAKEFPEPAIDTAIAKLAALNYLDDAAYSREFVAANQRTGDRGPRQVMQWLKQRGVDGDVIVSALAEQSAEVELTIARRVAKRVLRSPGSRSFGAQIQRVKQTLMQKGFDAATIELALDAEQPEEDAEREHELLLEQVEKVWRSKQRYTGYERRMKTKQALFRKGFDLDDIDQALDELE